MDQVSLHGLDAAGFLYWSILASPVPPIKLQCRGYMLLHQRSKSAYRLALLTFNQSCQCIVPAAFLCPINTFLLDFVESPTDRLSQQDFTINLHIFFTCSPTPTVLTVPRRH